MSKKIEFIQHAPFVQYPLHNIQTNVIVSVSTSSPFQPEPISQSVTAANGEDALAVSAFAVEPQTITMHLHTANGSLPTANWTSMRTIAGHVHMRMAEDDSDLGYDSLMVEAELSSLLAARTRFEAIGFAVGICGAAFLSLMAITMHYPWAAVAPGAVLMLGLSGFVLLRRRLRKGAGQDG